MIIDHYNRTHVSCPFRSGMNCTGKACVLWRPMPGMTDKGYCGPGGQPSAPQTSPPQPEPAIVVDKKTTAGVGAATKVTRK